jgi:hypothetical protein
MSVEHDPFVALAVDFDVPHALSKISGRELDELRRMLDDMPVSIDVTRRRLGLYERHGGVSSPSTRCVSTIKACAQVAVVDERGNLHLVTL